MTHATPPVRHDHSMGTSERSMSEHEKINPCSTEDFFALLALQSSTLLRMAAAMVGPDVPRMSCKRR